MAVIKIEFEHLAKLAYTTNSVRLATAALQRLMPPGTAKLTYEQAAGLVLQNDLDAICFFIQAGLQHRDKDLELRQIEALLDRERKAGRTIVEFSRPILQALKDGGFVDIVYAPTVDAEDGADRPTERAPSSV